MPKYCIVGLGSRVIFGSRIVKLWWFLCMKRFQDYYSLKVTAVCRSWTGHLPVSFGLVSFSSNSLDMSNIIKGRYVEGNSPFSLAYQHKFCNVPLRSYTKKLVHAFARNTIRSRSFFFLRRQAPLLQFPCCKQDAISS